MSAAETRAALIERDRTIRFWFGPARGDEAADKSARTGRRFAGRIRSVNKSLNAAFVDIGDGLDSYLPIKKSNKEFIVEGALIEVTVKSPPRQNKGATLKFVDDKVAQRAQGRMTPIDDPVIEAAKAIGRNARTIIVDDGRAKAQLESAGLRPDIQYEEKPVSVCLNNMAQTQNWKRRSIAQSPFPAAAALISR